MWGINSRAVLCRHIFQCCCYAQLRLLFKPTYPAVHPATLTDDITGSSETLYCPVMPSILKWIIASDQYPSSTSLPEIHNVGSYDESYDDDILNESFNSVPLNYWQELLNFSMHIVQNILRNCLLCSDIHVHYSTLIPA